MCALMLLPALLFSADTGNIVRFGNDIVVPEGQTVNGDVLGIHSGVRIYGEVKGSVVAIGGRMEIGKTAMVKDNLVIFCREYVRDPGATIKGDEVNFSTPVLGQLFDTIKFVFSNVLLIILFILISIIFLIWAFVYFLMNIDLEHTTSFIKENSVKSIMYGIFLSLLFSILIFLCVISIAGVVAIIPLTILFFTLTFVGYLATGLLVGQIIAQRYKWNPPVSAFVQILVGSIVLGIIVVIPFLGTLAHFVIWFAGLGGVVHTLLTKRDNSTNDNNTTTPMV